MNSTSPRSPSFDFDGRVAFVTGAARGQGRSHAVGFAEHGADVVLLDVPGTIDGVEYQLGDEAQLELTARRVEQHGVEALPLEADVRDERAVADAVQEAVDHFGRIDHLVNNAGVWGVGEAVAMEEVTWDCMVDINLTGAWHCAKHVARHVRERGTDTDQQSDGGTAGTIVSTGSTASFVGTYGSAHYAAAKHGLVGLTKTMALELAADGIRVNCVCPTGVDTPLIDGVVEAYGESALSGVSDRSGSMNVLDGQLLPPEAVTDAVLWLSSDAARYVTGTALLVDAGMTAK